MLERVRREAPYGSVPVPLEHERVGVRRGVHLENLPFSHPEEQHRPEEVERFDARRDALRVVHLHLFEALREVDGPKLNLALLAAAHHHVARRAQRLRHLVRFFDVYAQLVPFEEVEAPVLGADDGGVGPGEAEAEHSLDVSAPRKEGVARPERLGGPKLAVLHAARHDVVLERAPPHAQNLLRAPFRGGEQRPGLPPVDGEAVVRVGADGANEVSVTTERD
mmetsp:Transcript_17828/g.58310  ORF Transcript_17828/g.58310 Transcript_17828/m.58310 type:complete len:222 (+) Transcript_17828:1057-1722(+)